MNERLKLANDGIALCTDAIAQCVTAIGIYEGMPADTDARRLTINDAISCERDSIVEWQKNLAQWEALRAEYIKCVG